MNLFAFLLIHPVTSNEIHEHWLNIAVAVITFLSFICVLTTIIKIFWECHKSAIAKRSKVALFEDLIRHFWINNVITAVVKDKLQENKDAIPEEGIFTRMEVLESDLNFNESQMVRKPSPAVHQCELKMRNYNVSAESTYKAICDDKVALEIKLGMLDDLMIRGTNIINRLYNIALSENLKMRSKEEIIKEEYSNDIDTLDKIFEEQKQRKRTNTTVRFIK